MASTTGRSSVVKEQHNRLTRSDISNLLALVKIPTLNCSFIIYTTSAYRKDVKIPTRGSTDSLDNN